MFKDCKSGGYNLEDSKASIERLTRLVLLIAIAYTISSLKGKAIKSSGQQKYIGRERTIKQSLTKNSNCGRQSSQALPFDGSVPTTFGSDYMGRSG
jgi:hypothetical protein